MRTERKKKVDRKKVSVEYIADKERKNIKGGVFILLLLEQRT